MATYQKRSLNFIKAGLGKNQLIELQPSDSVAHYRKRRREGAVAPATQSQDVGYLGQILTHDYGLASKQETKLKRRTGM